MGGLPLLELNKLELEFLKLCDFDLHVRLEAIQEYGEQLVHHTLIHIPKTLVPNLQMSNTTSPTSLRQSRKRALEEVDKDNDLFVTQDCWHKRQTLHANTTSTQHPCGLYPMQQSRLPQHTKRHRPMSSPSPTKADSTTNSTHSISTA